MQSFHRSPARILFEVFCALAISACCVGAWLQTGASALLPAAAVTALYGLVHAFDVRRRRSPVPAASQPIEVVTTPKTIVPAAEPTLVPPAPIIEQLPPVGNSIEEDAKAEPEGPRPSRARRSKGAPKGRRGRASAREEEKIVEFAAAEELKLTEIAPTEERVTEVASPEEPKVTEVAPMEESKVTRLTPPEAAQAAAPPRPDETAPVPLTPLFEPKPFVRLQRAAFGRKA